MAQFYDARFVPPAPVLSVIVYPIGEMNGTASLAAQPDTGADICLVPLDHLDAIGAGWPYSSRLRGQWGNSRSVEVYEVDLEIAGHRFPGVEVVAERYSNEVLLGRNVLNKLILLLDGPGQQTDLLTRRPRRF